MAGKGNIFDVIGVLLPLAIVGGFGFGIFFLIRLLLKLKKRNDSKSIFYYVMMLLCLVIMGASWILNMGWLRVFLTLAAFPIIHAVVFIIINGKAITKQAYSVRLRIYTGLSFLTSVLSHVLFPDGGDEGGMYVFFGLIQDEEIVGLATDVSVVCIGIYIVVTILQLIEMGRIKKMLAEEAINQAEEGETDQPLS